MFGLGRADERLPTEKLCAVPMVADIRPDLVLFRGVGRALPLARLGRAVRGRGGRGDR